MINSIFENLMNEKRIQFFHLSDANHGQKVKFEPRDPAVPGESSDPRVSVAPALAECLVAIGAVAFEGNPLYLYELVGDPEIVPANSTVSDRKITDEHWVLETAIFNQVAKVKRMDIPDKLWDRLGSLNAGSSIPKELEQQQELLQDLIEYTEPIDNVFVGEAIDEEEDDNIKTVPAPMNFDVARAKNK